MQSAHLKRLSASLLLALSAAPQVHASELFPNLPAKTVGIQVKIQNFSAEDAGHIKASGFSFVRFGVWSDSLSAKAYQKQVSDAFAAAQSAGLPVLLTVRAIKPVSCSMSRSLPPDWLIVAAMALAVIADCLVATVPCTMWMRQKPRP